MSFSLSVSWENNISYVFVVIFVIMLKKTTSYHLAITNVFLVLDKTLKWIELNAVDYWSHFIHVFRNNREIHLP